MSDDSAEFTEYRYFDGWDRFAGLIGGLIASAGGAVAAPFIAQFPTRGEPGPKWFFVIALGLACLCGVVFGTKMMLRYVNEHIVVGNSKLVFVDRFRRRCELDVSEVASISISGMDIYRELRIDAVGREKPILIQGSLPRFSGLLEQLKRSQFGACFVKQP